MTSMIDHLVYGAPNLAAAVNDLAVRFGVRAEAGGQHVGLGTHNALLTLGPRTYLEVIAPDPRQPSPPHPRPFGLDALSVPRLVGWGVGCDDLDDAIDGSRSSGYDPGDAIEMTRTAPDGTVARWRLTLNAIGGGPVPFLISWGDSRHPAASGPRGLTLEALEIEHPDPPSLIDTLHALGAPDVIVTPADRVALAARIKGRRTTEVLR
jgi:hypothetical protein